MRLTTATVGALAAASATNIGASQIVAAAKAVVIDGTLSTGYSATSLAAAQAVAGAGDLTLTTAATNLGGRSVVVLSAGNDSGITFTVKGIGADGVSYASEVLTGANASRVATRTLFSRVTAITASGAAAANVSAGTHGLVATLDKPRRILFTSAGNDSGITFTVYGTDWNGQPISETLTGGNTAAVYTVYDYATVTAIWPSGATASTLTVGTNGVASSRPIILDEYAFAPTGIQVDVTGTVNYTVQSAFEDPNVVGYSSMTWVDSADTAVVAATATKQSSFAYAPKATRLTINSGTGSVQFHVLQSGSIAGI